MIIQSASQPITSSRTAGHETDDGCHPRLHRDRIVITVNGARFIWWTGTRGCRQQDLSCSNRSIDWPLQAVAGRQRRQRSNRQSCGHNESGLHREDCSAWKPSSAAAAPAVRRHSTPRPRFGDTPLRMLRSRAEAAGVGASSARRVLLGRPLPPRANRRAAAAAAASATVWSLFASGFACSAVHPDQACCQLDRRYRVRQIHIWTQAN